ncbi:hypothetical protein QUB75_23375 [Microcoleus sp. K1-B6]|uniref:hypothetical protein n=1 Tax=unclassified Microcoleus TaxID=2642155 RepID=UPI002FCFD673
MISCPDSTLLAAAFSLALPVNADRPQPQRLPPKYGNFTRFSSIDRLRRRQWCHYIFLPARGGDSEFDRYSLRKIDYFFELQIVAFN